MPYPRGSLKRPLLMPVACGVQTAIAGHCSPPAACRHAATGLGPTWSPGGSRSRQDRHLPPATTMRTCALLVVITLKSPPRSPFILDVLHCWRRELPQSNGVGHVAAAEQ